jgi:hypothetical protein
MLTKQSFVYLTPVQTPAIPEIWITRSIILAELHREQLLDQWEIRSRPPSRYLARLAR